MDGKNIQTGTGDFLGGPRFTRGYNRTSGDVFDGCVLMADMAESQAETDPTGEDPAAEGSAAAPFANWIIPTTAGIARGWPCAIVRADGGRSKDFAYVDNSILTLQTQGDGEVLMADLDTVASTTSDIAAKGDPLTPVNAVMYVQLAIAADATNHARVAGWAREIAAADDTVVDRKPATSNSTLNNASHRRRCYWFGGLPVTRRGT